METGAGHPFSEQVDYLFRHEAGRLVSVLTRIFGAHNLALAESLEKRPPPRMIDGPGKLEHIVEPWIILKAEA